MTDLTQGHGMAQVDAAVTAGIAVEPIVPVVRPVVLPESALEKVPLPLYQRVLVLTFILVPLAGLAVAMALAWGSGLGWLELSLLGVMYLLTGFGITIGFHRYFTHKSFETGRVMTAVLGVLGSMAAEGPLLKWVAFHRCHHQHSDEEHDPHSPHSHGTGWWAIVRGFWTAHMGWLLADEPANLDRYTADLRRDKLIRVISGLFPLWVALSMVIPAAVAGLVTMSWFGAFMGLLWGGLVRILLVHHVTWSVNSVCHLWGTRAFRSHDESRNNPIVGVLGLGEGWHNNHHAFPTSARHGLRWWEVDLSYIVIWAMSKVGLVWAIRVPTRERMESKRIRQQPPQAGYRTDGV